MVAFIGGARELHGVKSAADYVRKHRAAIAKKAGTGQRFVVHEDATPIAALINTGDWKVVCDCGAANATDPAWGIACCFGCGAVHTRVTFPRDHAQIEAVLLARPRPETRFWSPGETVATLTAENVIHLRGGR